MYHIISELLQSMRTCRLQYQKCSRLLQKLLLTFIQKSAAHCFRDIELERLCSEERRGEERSAIPGMILSRCGSIII